MPVKVDSSRCCSPLPFDCDLFLTEYEQSIVNELCMANLDEMWGESTMPTPPLSPSQSDCMGMWDPFTDGKVGHDWMMQQPSGSFNNQPFIDHDCMWSGQCSEGRCTSRNKSLIPHSSSWNRPETPFNFFSTSPINSFNDLTFDMIMNEPISLFLEPEPQQSVHQQQPQQEVQHQHQNHSSAEGNMYAMVNDHAYESSSPLSIKSEDEYVGSVSSFASNQTSLIQKPVPIVKVNGSSSKVPRVRSKSKKIVHKKSLLDCSNSILNTNASRPLLSSKKETSVLKPTIISVTNIKHLQNQSLHKLANVQIKPNRKISIVQDKNSLNRQLFQISSIPLVSPSSSDSEESSNLSVNSGEDSRKVGPFRRREHNDSERKRRDHLRNSFNNLRDQVPKLMSSEKRPPRIQILAEATDYVTELIDTHNTLQEQLQAEMEKKRLLNERLKSLQQLL